MHRKRSLIVEYVLSLFDLFHNNRPNVALSAASSALAGRLHTICVSPYRPVRQDPRFFSFIT